MQQQRLFPSTSSPPAPPPLATNTGTKQGRKHARRTSFPSHVIGPPPSPPDLGAGLARSVICPLDLGPQISCASARLFWLLLYSSKTLRSFRVNSSCICSYHVVQRHGLASCALQACTTKGASSLGAAKALRLGVAVTHPRNPHVEPLQASFVTIAMTRPLLRSQHSSRGLSRRRIAAAAGSGGQ